MAVIVGRYINGIGLNGLEYLMTTDGSCMRFDTVDDAREFLKDHGYTDDDIEDLTFEVVE